MSTTGTYNEYTFTTKGGPKGDWVCYLCKSSKATKKFIYTGGALEPGFKLSCEQCISSDFGRDFYSLGCTINIHQEQIEN